MWTQVICHKAIQGSLSEVGCGAYTMCGKLRQLVCDYSVHLCFLSCLMGTVSCGHLMVLVGTPMFAGLFSC